jgi:hypothetical protein
MGALEDATLRSSLRRPFLVHRSSLAHALNNVLCLLAAKPSPNLSGPPTYMSRIADAAFVG